MKKFNNGITVEQLIDYLNENGMGMNTKIMPLGAETKYVRIDKDNKMVILDEVDNEEE